MFRYAWHWGSTGCTSQKPRWKSVCQLALDVCQPCHNGWGPASTFVCANARNSTKRHETTLCSIVFCEDHVWMAERLAACERTSQACQTAEEKILKQSLVPNRAVIFFLQSSTQWDPNLLSMSNWWALVSNTQYITAVSCHDQVPISAGKQAESKAMLMKRAKEEDVKKACRAIQPILSARSSDIVGS